MCMASKTSPQRLDAFHKELHDICLRKMMDLTCHQTFLNGPSTQSGFFIKAKLFDFDKNLEEMNFLMKKFPAHSAVKVVTMMILEMGLKLENEKGASRWGENFKLSGVLSSL